MASPFATRHLDGNPLVVYARQGSPDPDLVRQKPAASSKFNAPGGDLTACPATASTRGGEPVEGIPFERIMTEYLRRDAMVTTGGLAPGCIRQS